MVINPVSHYSSSSSLTPSSTMIIIMNIMKKIMRMGCEGGGFKRHDKHHCIGDDEEDCEEVKDEIAKSRTSTIGTMAIVMMMMMMMMMRIMMRMMRMMGKRGRGRSPLGDVWSPLITLRTHTRRSSS